MIKSRRGRLVIYLFVILLIAMVVTYNSAFAELSIFKSTKQLTYDIYIGNSQDSTAVIKNVDIDRFEEIADETFLVIEVHGFNIKGAEGFIRLESIKAILPSNYFKVINI